MSNDSLIAAFDFGTTGVRVLILDSQGQSISSGHCEVAIQQSVSGLAEQSLDDFWKALLTAWKMAVEKSIVNTNEIAALGFSHQRCTFAFADANGQPLSNFIVWMDRRGIPYLDRVNQQIGRMNYYQITGLPIYYISSLSKILWFADLMPEMFDHGARIWPISNFILNRLGVPDPPMDHATASFIGLMDGIRREWCSEIVYTLGLETSMLPPLVPPGTVVGRLMNQQAAAEFGLPVGLPLVIGGGDQQCAALGSGMIHLGQSLINLGTATALMTAVDKPIRDPNGIIPCVSHAAPGKWEMEGHTQASGIILQRFRDEFAWAELALAKSVEGDVYDYLTMQAKSSTPCANGLIFLPMLNGSTVPIDDPTGTGALIGLKPAHTRADTLRAVLEGICFENRWILETMMNSGAVIRETFITGGASKSSFWNQLHADILGRPVVQIKTSNAALVGAAICAALGVGIFLSTEEGVERFAKLGVTYLPNPVTTSQYDRMYSLFLRAYHALSNAKVFEDLRSLIETR